MPCQRQGSPRRTAGAPWPRRQDGQGVRLAIPAAAAAAMAHQLDLLEDAGAACGGGGPHLLERPGLRLRHWRGWLPDAADWHAALMDEVPWRQERITLWGRRHLLPRLTCWMADPGCLYSYSGLINTPRPWTATAQRLKARLEAQVGCRFDSLLLNLYRDGRDRMGWHADDEPELDPQAPIASLSLGASRSFQLRPRRPDNGERLRIDLELGDGDLLLMDPPTQKHWQHQLPARRRVSSPRINLTFRRLRPPARNPAGRPAPGRAGHRSHPLGGHQ